MKLTTSALSRQMNDVNNDIQRALGRLDEALDLLRVWAAEHPDDGLARMSLNLVGRCEEDQ